MNNIKRYFVSLALALALAAALTPVDSYPFEAQEPSGEQFLGLVLGSTGCLTTIAGTTLEQAGADQILGLANKYMGTAAEALQGQEVGVHGLAWSTRSDGYYITYKYQWIYGYPNKAEGHLNLTVNCSVDPAGPLAGSNDAYSGFVITDVPVTREGGTFVPGKPEKITVCTRPKGASLVTSVAYYDGDGGIIRFPGTLYPPIGTGDRSAVCDGADSKLEHLRKSGASGHDIEIAGQQVSECREAASAKVKLDLGKGFSIDPLILYDKKWNSGLFVTDSYGLLTYKFDVVPEPVSGVKPDQWKYTVKLDPAVLGGAKEEPWTPPYEPQIKMGGSLSWGLTDPFSITPATSRYAGMPALTKQVFVMLDGGAKMADIGRSIGRSFAGTSSTGMGLFGGFQPWYLAGWETMLLLDDWDYYGDDLMGIDFGIAVAEAVRAAGGGETEALRMGAFAIGWAGGTKEEAHLLASGNYKEPDLRGILLMPHMPFALMAYRDMQKVSFKDSGFSTSLLEDKQPGEFINLQVQLDFGFGPAISRAKVDPKVVEEHPKLGGFSNFTFGQHRFVGMDGFNYTPGEAAWIDKMIERRRAEKFMSGSLWDNSFFGTKVRDFTGVEKGDASFKVSPHVQSVFMEQNLNRDVQTAVVPDDPLFAPRKEDSSAGSMLKQGLSFTMGLFGVGGQSSTEKEATWQWYMPVIGMRPMGQGSAWDVFDGAKPNTVVAVIDSGLDLKHPDRPRYLWTNEDEIPGNGIDDDNNGYVDDVNGWNFLNETPNVQDDYGHGSFVTGIIAAATNNGRGMAGINPGAQIMTLKVTGRDGLAKSLNVYRAVRYAVDNGARVINISLGRNKVSRLEQIGINYAWSMGCLVVVAAGNQAGRISEYGPPGVPRALCVAATDFDDKRRGTSNLGRTVVLAAPGEGIYSLSSSTGKHDGRIMPMGDTEYHTLNGTSFSAPMVAAVASLKWAAQPALTNRQMANLLMATARDLNEAGWDVRTGAGMLDARAAMQADGTQAMGVRITDLIVGRTRRTIDWVDLYGVVSGPVKDFTVAVASEQNPDEGDYKTVYSSSGREVDNGLLCRIPGNMIGKQRWTFRLTARGKDGSVRSVAMGFDKDGQVLY
ncbi:S8 family peptidase [Salidesulfovibrio onnuriiensis]|uniref:S8 family peptidase n=1 Tax=Salidesulfovibrio onnuriiensis TaxID=2583823 RepID=UPI0011CB3244|nr:S8 family peptidase [Salidesulfovibrio onnuriiensis]